MNYQVFARKYRPQNFDEVVGQDHISHTLKNAIAQDRLAHAYLFVGPRGTGKTSTARILAKALNCAKGPTANPCGECDSCREIAQGNCMDVLEIDGASNNGVEQVRDLRDNVRYAPTSGKFKIYIIDEVHMLTTAAFNALLKTLEEPPAHVKFFFATTEAQKVLPTILSRCQRFDMRRIPAHLIAEHLQYIAGKESIELEEAAAMAIAKGAEGGLRDAESMLDQLVAFCGNAIKEGDVLSIFGFTAQETVSELCAHIIAGDTPQGLHIVHEQAEAGRDLSRLMADLISHLRDLLVAKADPESIAEEFGNETLESFTRQAEQLSMEHLLELIEQFAAADARMKWAPNKKLHFEIAVIKAVQTLNQVTLTEILENLAILRAGGEIKPKQIQRSAPPKSSTPKLQPEQPAKARVLEGKIGLSAALREKIEQKPEPQAAVPPTPEPTLPAPLPAPAPLEPAPLPEPQVPDLLPVELPVQEVIPPISAPAEDELFSSLPPKPEESLLFPSDLAAPEASPSAKEEPAPESAPEVAEPVTLDADLWPRLVREAREKRRFIASMLEMGALVEVTADTALLGLPPGQGITMETLNRPANLKFLEELFGSVAGRPLQVKLEFRENLTIIPVPVEEKVVEPERDPMEAFKADPLIRKALELFKADIQPA